MFCHKLTPDLKCSYELGHDRNTLLNNINKSQTYCSKQLNK